jgi:type I restriction enzyme, S subunit
LCPATSSSACSFQGGIEYARCRGIISPAYTILYARDPSNHGYLAALFKSRPFIGNLTLYVTGIRQGQNIDYTKLSASFIPLPPPAEQPAIVRFLEAVDRRVSRFVRAKRRLIELLTEQKLALITHAVTRGLHPDAKLKASGLPWVGDIPQDWRRLKLNRVCESIRDGTHNPPPAAPGIHRLLSVRNIMDGKFCLRDDDRTMSPEAFASLERSYIVRRGDVVLALVGATTGKSAVVGEVENVSVQRSLGILRPRATVIGGDYLQLLVQSHIVQHQIREIMDKYAAQPGIYLDDVSSLQIVLPPLSAQEHVLGHVREACADLEATLDVARCELALIREYHTRLMADVVTGKLDVRSAAGHLPADEPDAVEPVEDAIAETEEDADAADGEAVVVGGDADEGAEA